MYFCCLVDLAEFFSSINILFNNLLFNLLVSALNSVANGNHIELNKGKFQYLAYKCVELLV